MFSWFKNNQVEVGWVNDTVTEAPACQGESKSYSLCYPSVSSSAENLFGGFPKYSLWPMATNQVCESNTHVYATIVINNNWKMFKHSDQNTTLSEYYNQI